MTRIVTAVALSLALGTAPAWVTRRARADDPAPLAPAPLLERIGRIAQDLARRGRRADAEELLDVLTKLHAAAASVGPHREAVVKALAKAKPAPLPLADASRACARAAADLVALLPDVAGEAKTELARQALRLDATQRAAHEALGHVEEGGAWIPRALVPARRRRAEIQEALRRARRLEIAVEVEQSWLGVLEAVHGRKGLAVRCGAVSAHSASHSREQLVRQFREALRGVALSNWLVTGELAVPVWPREKVLAFVASKPAYDAAVEVARRAGELSEQATRDAIRIGSCFDVAGYSLLLSVGETEIGADAYLYLAYDLPFDRKYLGCAQPTLRAGQLNWVYGRFLGHPMPPIAWTEKHEEKKGVTSDAPVEERERREMLRLARAGLAGSRAWIRWLARRHEDPPWSRSMVEEVGRIQGNDLMKSTLVVDFLHEVGEFPALLRTTYGEPPAPRTFEEALGALPAFEQRWREWLFADDPPAGLAQVLAGPDVAPVSPVDRAVLDTLDKIRRSTLGKDAPALGMDRELSEGCRAHAAYLAKHPRQCAAWPDAHEEYPGEEGFSPAGARAGLSSVVVAGVPDHVEAIDGWMGTFYHRLPLIHPGLVRIGWGFEKTIAVLDSGSLVAPPEFVCWVAWPPSSATGVPRRFRAELPNPVPGEDQSAWGYPVTLQLFGHETEPDVRMRLHAGPSRNGPEVPCHFSTPHRPTNVELAPAGSFCLIPKAALAANTTYTVAVDGWPRDAAGADWQFRTGSEP